MKRLLSSVAVFVLLMAVTLPVLGEDRPGLDLNEALKLAQNQNLDLKMAELNLKKARLEYQKNLANNLLKQSQYSNLQADYSLSSARNTYQKSIASVVSNTISQYTGLWLAGLDLTIKEKSLEKEKMTLAEVKAQYEIGDVGNIDLLTEENAYNDARFTLDTARDDYQQSIKEFKTTLGLSESLPELTPVGLPEVWEITEEEAINTALKNSIDLQLQEDQLKLAGIDQERAKVSSSELDRNIKKIDLQVVRLETAKTREDIASSAQQAFYQFKQAVKNMDLKKQRLNEAEQKYDLIKKQFEMGLGTKVDVLQYEINKLQADYQYKSTIATYYQRELTLRQAMGLEVGVLNDETDQGK